MSNRMSSSWSDIARWKVEKVVDSLRASRFPSPPEGIPEEFGESVIKVKTLSKRYRNLYTSCKEVTSLSESLSQALERLSKDVQELAADSISESDYAMTVAHTTKLLSGLEEFHRDWSTLLTNSWLSHIQKFLEVDIPLTRKRIQQCNVARMEYEIAHKKYVRTIPRKLSSSSTSSTSFASYPDQRRSGIQSSVDASWTLEEVHNSSTDSPMLSVENSLTESEKTLQLHKIRKDSLERYKESVGRLVSDLQIVNDVEAAEQMARLSRVSEKTLKWTANFSKKHVGTSRFCRQLSRQYSDSFRFSMAFLDSQQTYCPTLHWETLRRVEGFRRPVAHDMKGGTVINWALLMYCMELLIVGKNKPDDIKSQFGSAIFSAGSLKRSGVKFFLYNSHPLALSKGGSTAVLEALNSIEKHRKAERKEENLNGAKKMKEFKTRQTSSGRVSPKNPNVSKPLVTIRPRQRFEPASKGQVLLPIMRSMSSQGTSSSSRSQVLITGRHKGPQRRPVSLSDRDRDSSFAKSVPQISYRRLGHRRENPTGERQSDEFEKPLKVGESEGTPVRTVKSAIDVSRQNPEKRVPSPAFISKLYERDSSDIDASMQSSVESEVDGDSEGTEAVDFATLILNSGELRSNGMLNESSRAHDDLVASQQPSGVGQLSFSDFGGQEAGAKEGLSESAQLEEELSETARNLVNLSLRNAVRVFVAQEKIGKRTEDETTTFVAPAPTVSPAVQRTESRSQLSQSEPRLLPSQFTNSFPSSSTLTPPSPPQQRNVRTPSSSWMDSVSKMPDAEQWIVIRGTDLSEPKTASVDVKVSRKKETVFVQLAGNVNARRQSQDNQDASSEDSYFPEDGSWDNHASVNVNENHVYAHGGFSEAADEMVQELLPYIDPSMAVNITGHSLGAAVGCLVALRLQALGFEVGYVICFGSPKFLAWEREDKAITAQLARSFPSTTFLRVYTYEDVVRHLPPISHYGHFGSVLMLLSNRTFYYLKSPPEVEPKSFGDGGSSIKRSLKEHRTAYYHKVVEEFFVQHSQGARSPSD